MSTETILVLAGIVSLFCVFGGILAGSACWSGRPALARDDAEWRSEI